MHIILNSLIAGLVALIIALAGITGVAFTFLGIYLYQEVVAYRQRNHCKRRGL